MSERLNIDCSSAKMNHSNIDYSIANQIMSTCGKRGYTLIRDKLLKVLPHPVTLQRMFAFFRLTPGFIVQTFTYLLKKSELKSWRLGDYCLSFCFDEFAIANLGMLDMFNEQVYGKCLKITKNVSFFCIILSFRFKLFEPTLEYLITLQYLLNVHNGKVDFIWLAKKDNLMLLNRW